MDCPSEEQMIRMKLEPYNEVKQLSFDIPNRAKKFCNFPITQALVIGLTFAISM